jgi:uncharacterized protein with FMN-binding domain
MNNSATPPKRAHPAVTAIVVIAMIGMVAAAIVALNHKDSVSNTAAMGTTPTSTASPSTSVSTTPAATAASGSYKDGTYTANTSYFTPDGQEDAKLTITIANNIVTASNFSEQALSGEGERYQNRFDSNYKSEVVGQKVSDIQLSRVAGASLTTDGFMQALQQIQQNAAS